VPAGPREASTGPVERVRRRLQRAGHPGAAGALPRGYTRLGRVLLVRLPENLRPEFRLIGRAYADELGVGSVLRHAGPVLGEYRQPQLEVIFGTDSETEVLEHGVRWRFDAARILFARGNKSERARAGAGLRPGSHVIDLFAGIGYFAIPAALAQPSVRVTAAEANPLAYRYLLENLGLNRVSERVRALLGDNRELPLPLASADRVLLGFLPSAIPWLDRALPLLRPEGGTLIVHLVTDSNRGAGGAAEKVRTRLERLGVAGSELVARVVKPYGPGRVHAVVEARISGH
jgi:tRNA wybutosine-synthesizing protein 2